MKFLTCGLDWNLDRAAIFIQVDLLPNVAFSASNNPPRKSNQTCLHPRSLMTLTPKPCSSLLHPPFEDQTDGRPHEYASGLPRAVSGISIGLFVLLPWTRGRKVATRNMMTMPKLKTTI